MDGDLDQRWHQFVDCSARVTPPLSDSEVRCGCEDYSRDSKTAMIVYTRVVMTIREKFADSRF